MANNSLIHVDLKGPSLVAVALINKISEAIGGLARPMQTRRMAKANADATIIETKATIEAAEIHSRALTRLVQEEARRQENIESIVAGAIPLLEEEARPDEIDDDWIANFFERCRLYSDEEMRTLWSRLLAGEANSSGSFSKRTVNLLADFDKVDAQLFTNLCRYCWIIGSPVPIIENESDLIYTDNNVNFGTISHLESIGLIHFDGVNGFVRGGLPREFIAGYFDKRVSLTLPSQDNNMISIGRVRFTTAGLQLAQLAQDLPVEGYLEFMLDKWERAGFSPRLGSPLERSAQTET